MSLIIYSKTNSKNLYGIKQINELTFKKLMYNEIHKKCRFVIQKNKIEQEFEIKLNVNKEEVDVILMSELSESQLNNYLETFEDETDNIEKYAEFLSIITYNQINPEKFKIKKKLDLILSSMSEYWENPSNCNYTLTDKFIDRRFNGSNYIGNIDIINKTLLGMDKNGNIDWNVNEMDYLNDIIKDNTWKH